ncbi:DUF6151 family protein [Epibacterium ulvae]|uniref:DUF6151 family protein n=1 Tax=Epibacterium ulvae TaxID=1156985 RepID=UPI00249245C2|nr:DUF6151 family protein [Epibacterium ulvae]
MFGRQKLPPQAQELSCDCGKVTAVASLEAVKAATRVTCFCGDCRAADTYLRRESEAQITPKASGIELLHMSPDGLLFTNGIEHIRVFRLSKRGPLRWYTTCCNTPIATTLPKPDIPLCALQLRFCKHPETLGPARVKAFVPQKNGPPRTEGVMQFGMALVNRIVSARLSGRWKENPFFNMETKTPVSEPVVLSQKERAALDR